jgi:hypothetical protein
MLLNSPTNAFLSPTSRTCVDEWRECGRRLRVSGQERQQLEFPAAEQQRDLNSLDQSRISPSSSTRASPSMPFELPALPYAYDVLEPYVDSTTMNIHHTKHHQVTRGP